MEYSGAPRMGRCLRRKAWRALIGSWTRRCRVRARRGGGVSWCGRVCRGRSGARSGGRDGWNPIPPCALSAPAPPPSVDSAAPPAPLDAASLLELGINARGAAAGAQEPSAFPLQCTVGTGASLHDVSAPPGGSGAGALHSAAHWRALGCSQRVRPAGRRKKGALGPAPGRRSRWGRSMRRWGPPHSRSALVVTIRAGYRRAVNAPPGAGEPSARV